MCGLLCSVGQFVSGCGGTDPGICSNCSMCSTGFYAAGCGGAQSGVCTECSKCKDNTYAIGCGSVSPGTCQSASSESASQRTTNFYPALPGIIIAVIFFSYVITKICRDFRTRKRRELAVALREETLHAQGMACVRLVNRTPRVVQVQPPHHTACVSIRRPRLSSVPKLPHLARWVTFKATRSNHWGCFRR